MMAFLAMKVFHFFLSSRRVLLLFSLINSSFWASFSAAPRASHISLVLCIQCGCEWVGKFHLCRDSELPQLSWATVWRLAHWRLQRSELKNYSQFHFPAVCAFRCLWRQARPVKWRGGGRARTPTWERERVFENVEALLKNAVRWMDVCVCVCVYPQLTCTSSGASFKFSVQWLVGCVFVS